MNTDRLVYNPAVLERVRHLHLRARQLVAGAWHGSFRSIRVGHDVEFTDYASYTAGDPLRDVDWRVLARADRLVVKRYRAETELVATLVLDASADLGSTSVKFEQAILLTATLAHLFQLQGMPFALHIGAGDHVPSHALPARTGRSHLAQVLLHLASVRPAGEASLDKLFRRIGERLPLRSLITVVSDFAEEPSTWTATLDALARQRADIRAFHLYDPRERDLRFDQPLLVYSPEAGRDEPLDPVAMRESFMTETDTAFGEIRDAVRRRRGIHQLVAADMDLTDTVARFLRGLS